MKKYFITVLFALFTVFVSAQVMNDGSRYAQNSVLKSGKWFKIEVEKSGIYKLTYEKLVSMGITNPANVRVFGYGGALLPELFTQPYIDDLPEVAIYMKKSADGTFKAGDYILFYAQGVVSWSYSIPSGTNTAMFHHKINHYSDKGYYFLTCDAGVGKKISTISAPTETPNGDIVDFTHYDLHEKDLINLPSGGREFYGEWINSLTPIKFNTPNMIAQPERMRVKAVNRTGSAINIDVTLNGIYVNTLSIDPPSSGDIGRDRKSSPWAITPAPADTVRVALTCSATASANLDFIEINVRRRLIITENEFYFRNKTTQNQFRRFVVANANANTQIWDITNKQNIKQISTTRLSDTLTFVAKIDSIREYLAINPLLKNSFPEPVSIFAIDNQNLHAMPQADFVIIANKDFLGQAERLAQAHRIKDGYVVNVVDAEKVYNEFSSGTPDATAYRRFVKMFYDRAYSSQNTKSPKYLLLFGDGSFDNRGLLHNTTDPIRRLLTYQAVNSVSGINSYVTDDYFGYMDDNTGDNSGELLTSQQLKIGVGRFPVYTLEQAKTLVDKTINYMNNEFRGSWKNQILYVADDGNAEIKTNNQGGIDTIGHSKDADEVSKITAKSNPDILIRKLYLDAYKQIYSAAGYRYPDVERILDDYINQGILIINYMGHGSMNNWAEEQILTTQKINEMSNKKFPLYITATCDFTGWDQFIESAGEKLLWNKNGGTMALFSTTRTVTMSGNAILNKNFAAHLFDRDEDCNQLALGDVFRLSKNLQTTQNKFAFTLVGDPALKLVYPHQAKVITDSINFNPVNSLAFDTVSALGIVHISGHIENCYGDEIQGFNGFVNIHVFDKEEIITTLNNPAHGANEINIHFQYKDRPNPIFVGSAEVKNGKFRTAFVVPKEIKYNFGTGRIVYYASEDNLGMEANGHFEDFIIGGEATNIDIDTIGPEVKLYMNTPTFKNGGQVNTSPLFVAEVFDKNGINSAGSVIGHNITMRLSGVNKKGEDIMKYNTEEIILNNYYRSELDSYQKGKVEYKLNNLEEGTYTIKFRIWNMFNNSTTAELYFVTEDTKIDADAYIYPNPSNVGEPITFYIEHDRPSQELTAKISVCDMTGRQLQQSVKKINTTGTTTEIHWNPATEGGVWEQGFYFVRLELSTPNEKSAIIPLKLIIKAQ